MSFHCLLCSLSVNKLGHAAGILAKQVSKVQQCQDSQASLLASEHFSLWCLSFFEFFIQRTTGSNSSHLDRTGEFCTCLVKVFLEGGTTEQGILPIHFQRRQQFGLKGCRQKEKV